MNLSLKVVSTLLLVLMTTMAISGWVSVTKERNVLKDLLQMHGQSLSNTIAVVCIESLLSEDYPVLDTFLETTGRERNDILSIEVMQNGKVVSNYVASDEDLADRVIFNSDVLFAMQTDQPPIKLGEIRLGLSDRQNKKIIATGDAAKVRRSLADLQRFKPTALKYTEKSIDDTDEKERKKTHLINEYGYTKSSKSTKYLADRFQYYLKNILIPELTQKP